MSCNGCRILRKGCNDNCVLRQSLQAFESPQAQANATVFVAKFFGRAGLISFLSSVPQSHRPALFQSLLFEACGRTVNPVNGAVGLLWTGNWNLCQSAVDTVLRGGIPRSLPEFSGLAQSPELDEDNNNDLYGSTRDLKVGSDERRGLDLRLTTAGFPARMTARGRSKRRPPASPSEESETTTMESGFVCGQDHLVEKEQEVGCRHETKLLRLFV